ncbi:MAG: DUF4476 domain-containing protein [Flavobacteriales bacterium]|nr:DUF4476 domain-containing protein [Flavobacteriales bacterium]
MLLTTICLLGIFISSHAQSSNLIIFSEDLQPFFAYVNGIMQNDQPLTNVKITGLTSPQNSIKIVFKDGNIPDLTKTMYFQEMGVEATAKLVNTKKGLKLRYFGEVPIASAPSSGATEIVYHTQPIVSTGVATTTGATSTSVTVTETTTTSTENVNVSTQTGATPTGLHMSTDIAVTETTTQTTGGTGESISIDMNVGGISMDVDLNIMDGGTGTSTTTTSSSTTTTTTTGDSWTDGTTTTLDQPTTVYVNGYTGRIGCAYPTSDISAIKAAMENEAFGDTKLMTGKQALKGKCFTVTQVKELAQLFTFADGKLEFSKFAYDFTYDLDNYYQMNSIFDHDSDKEELNKYVSTK